MKILFTHKASLPAVSDRKINYLAFFSEMRLVLENRVMVL